VACAKPFNLLVGRCEKSENEAVQQNANPTRRTFARLKFADHVDRFAACDRAPGCPDRNGSLGWRVGGVLVGVDDPGVRMVRASQGFGEKVLGGGCIAFGREQEVDRCTLGIHRPVQVYPFAFHPDVRLVDPPRIVCCLEPFTQAPLQFRRNFATSICRRPRSRRLLRIASFTDEASRAGRTRPA